MCETVADFALVQCCHSCNTDVPSFGRKVFARGEQSSECYDRHNPGFCRNFVEKRNMWTKEGQMGCSGDGASLAFRICRKTCGYCNETLYRMNLFDPMCPVIG
ncbi:unnamed protein product [Auanema sp. JU1783]|nr:unnamed protein product [Auanema sp. JU1783]